MQINNIQSYNNSSKPSFGMKIFPSQPLRHAVYVSRDLMDSPIYSKSNEKFLRKFYDSLIRIKKSKQADFLSIYQNKNGDKCIITEYLNAANYGEKAHNIVTLNCKKTNDKSFGRFLHFDSGANAMKALIKYAKTIKDVPEQKLNLKKRRIKNIRI